VRKALPGACGLRELDAIVVFQRKGAEMKFVQTTARRVGIAGELVSFFARNKRWWLLPVIFVVLLTGVIIVVAQSSALAPFIYTLF
jgi:hypothetical protein